MADTTTKEGQEKFDAFVERMEKIIPDATDTTKAVPKAAAKPEKPAPNSDEPTEQETDDEQPDGDSESPDEELETAEDEEADTDTDSDEESDEDEADADRGAKAEGDEPDEEEEETDDEEAEPDPEFEAAAKRNKIPTTVDDLPEEARPLVQKKLKEITAGFTRAMQEARAYRTEEATFRAEQLFREENPIEYALDFIESQMKADPKFAERLNERWSKLEDPEQQRAFQVIVKDARKTATDKVTAQQREQEQLVTRADEVSALTEKLAAKLGLPMEFADRAVALRVRENAAKPNGKPDITEAEIQEIIAGEAKVYGRHVRAHKRESTKQYIKNKTKDAKQTPVVRSGQGNSPAPAKESTKGLTLEQKMDRTAARIFPGTA